MTVINQDTLILHQRNLRAMINDALAARDFCCETGQLDMRDTLATGVGYLMLAEGALGQISMTDPQGGSMLTASAEGGGGGGGSK